MRQTTTGVGLVALLVLTIPFASSVFAQDESPQASRDWAQWLGPQRDGHIQESAWLAGWPKLQVEEAWKQDVGIGYASVSVVGDRAYTAGFKGGEDTIYCLEAATGKVVWKHSYDAKKYALMNAGGPSATPSIVDSRVYTVSRDAVMLCLSADKGDVLWKKDLKKTHQAKVPTWGFSGSPLVRGDRVYVDVGTIIAFDRRTGEEVWKTSRYRAGYSSPIAFRFENKDYLAVFPANGFIVLDEADGSEIASYPWDTNYDV
ncbi:MAG: outer membrane protein assembly factor BamB family protein, partial [Planctomycetota bacterium]